MPAPAARGGAALAKAAAPTAAPPTPTAGVEEDGSAATPPAPAPPATTAGVVTAPTVGAPPPTAAGDDAVPADAELPLAAAAAASPDGADAPTGWSPMATDGRSEDRGRQQRSSRPDAAAPRVTMRPPPVEGVGGDPPAGAQKNKSRATRHDAAAGWGVVWGVGGDPTAGAQKTEDTHPRVTIKGAGWGGLG